MYSTICCYVVVATVTESITLILWFYIYTNTFYFIFLTFIYKGKHNVWGWVLGEGEIELNTS